MDWKDRMTGLLLGTAVGDALGLPREGLSPRRAARMFGGAPLTHRFLLGRGMVSDDTEHACMVAQALLVAPGDARRFARSLAWRLRGWFLGLPAGIGWATVRAIGRLWLGFPPERSGVWSAGNGPAMRAPILGAWLGDDTARLETYVRASTRLTHTDPKAEQGALAVALAAREAVSAAPGGLAPPRVLALLRERTSGEELRAALAQVEDHLTRGASAAELAAALGLERGVTGYINHTVPVALYCWLRHPGDFRRAVEEVILLGGDTDTTAAITGALSGATVGAAGLPADWLRGLADWPRSARFLAKLGERLAAQRSAAPGGAPAPGPVPLFWPAIPLRNAIFLAAILGHGFRRLLPPY